MSSNSNYGGSRATKLFDWVYANHEPVCFLGGEFIPEGERTVEHVIPRSLGGTDAFENLRPACKSHNASRGNRPLEEWRATNTNEVEWLLFLNP
jgi:5-methylcytosine-specific restriction endonuclease McrA